MNNKRTCATCGKTIIPREGLDGRRDGWTHFRLTSEEWKAMIPHTPLPRS